MALRLSPTFAKVPLMQRKVVVVVNGAGVALCAALLAVHLRDLFCVGGVFRPLVLAHAQKAREAERDAFCAIDEADGSHVHGRDREVSREHLPNLARLEPDVARERARLRHAVVRARRVEAVLVQRLGMSSQRLVREAGAVDAGALALSVIRPNRHQVARVGHALQIVLFDLEPVERAARGLVRGVRLERLDHEALAVALHGGVEPLGDAVLIRNVGSARKVKLAIDDVERGLELLAAEQERLLQQRLAVEEEQVEGEDAHLHRDVVDARVLALARREHLERLDLARLPVHRHRLRVQDERLNALAHRARDHRRNVGILRGHVLRVS
eukprot:1665469-Pleurochrysis_carterae.AAC.2